MEVVGIKRSPEDYSGRVASEYVLGADRLLEPLPDADLFVITLPLSTETRGLVDETVFDSLS
jgi:phosphoglycerate dehydrogenase-like enzyme